MDFKQISKTWLVGLTLSAITFMTHAADWKLDSANTKVGFLLQGLLPIKAQFSKFEGNAVYDPKNLKDFKMSFIADSDSLDAGLASYRLKDPDNFAVEKFPKIEFKSTSVIVDNDHQGKLTGDLTMRGVTKPVTLDITVDLAQSNDKQVTFSSSSKVKRSDWGMSSNPDLAADDVELNIQGKLIPQ